MEPNPHESPQAIPPRRSRSPWIAGLIFSVAVWLFLGSMMFMQYHDEAAHYMPRAVVNGWGFAVVECGLVASSLYLWRALMAPRIPTSSLKSQSATMASIMELDKARGYPMAALTGRTCPACGVQHELCLESSDFFKPDKWYEYTCPNVGKVVKLGPPEEWAKVVQARPPGSIAVVECT